MNFLYFQNFYIKKSIFLEIVLKNKSESVETLKWKSMDCIIR
jgi:hypothetical protein